MSLSTFQSVSFLITSKFCLLLDLLVVSSGCLGNNGYPMSISAFHFCLFFSFSLSASDLVSHDQTQFGSLSGRSHTVVVRFSSFCCFEVIFQLEERLWCYPIRFFKGVVLILQLIFVLRPFSRICGYVVIHR